MHRESHVLPSGPGGSWRRVDGHMRWVPDSVGVALDARDRSLADQQVEDRAFAKALDAVKGALLMDDAARKASLTQGGSWGPGVPMGGGNLGGTTGSLISRLSQNLAASFGRPSDEVEAALAQQGMTWGPPFAPGRPLNPFFGIGRPPRTWDYKPGENVQVVPRWGRISFKTIRSLWENYDIAQICLVPGTKIIAQRGLVPIEEIVVGDEVLTHRGRWRRVYHTMANPVGGREMRRVKAGGLDEMVMTAEHPVLAARYTHTQTRKRVMRDMEWVPAGELRSRGSDKAAPWHYDAAVLPALEHSVGMVLDLAETLGEDFSVSGGKIWRGCRVNPVPAAVPFAATLGRLLGWYLAEGSQSGGRSIQFALAATERAEAEQILADFQALFGLRGRIDPAHTGEGLVVLVNSAVVARLFACGTARTKRLPTWAWNGTRAFFTAMLDAWAKGDGCVSRRGGMVERTYVVTASETLARQMQLVAVSLGLKPSVVLHRHAEDRVPALIRGAEVHSSPTHHTVDWRSGETARTGRYSFEADGHFLATAIQEVAPSDYDGLVYNIEVEEDHSYVTTGGTVHNCTNHQINDVISLNYHFEAAQGVREDVSDEILTAREFFDAPDKERPFRQWLYKFLMNVVVLDAGCLYIRRNEAGEPIALEVTDGATILKLVDYYGRTPSDEDDNDPNLTPAGVFGGKITPAYIQIIEGMVWDWIAKDDMIYQPWHPQPNSQYGRCALEAVLLTANTDMRFQWHFLNYFTQGSIPTGFMEAPPDMSDPTQIAEWQQYWDAMMIGDQAKLRQIRFVPAGSKYSAVGAAAEKFDPEFPLYLMRRVCAAFGITPADLGFTDTVNKATSETQVDVQFRVGTMPLVRYVEGVINMFLAQHLKLRVRLRFDTAQEIEDRLAIAQAESYQIKAGVISPDEPRTRLGYPIDLNRPTPRFIDNTRNGPVPLIALMSLAGDTDPETYGPSRSAKMIDHPFVPIPGVMPPIGSQEAKDADNTTAAIQQNMLALAAGKPPPFPDDETTSPPTPKQPRKTGAASKELAATLVLLGRTLTLLKGQSVSAAGIAVVARDSGRVLMIQRDNVDPSKKASGRWEMPGGRRDGSEGTWEAAVREWQEETGNKLPAGDRVTEWNSDDDSYRLFVYAIKAESDINLNPDRQAMEVVDPDHPNAQTTEVMAWWTPKDAKSAGKAIRKELRDFDWSLLSDAVEKDGPTGGITAATGMTGVDLREDDEDDDEDEASKSESVALQLRQWRENAKNRLRKGLPPRRFVSTDLPSDLADRVWQKLETATTREDIEAAFARAAPVASAT